MKSSLDELIEEAKRYQHCHVSSYNIAGEYFGVEYNDLRHLKRQIKGEVYIPGTHYEFVITDENLVEKVDVPEYQNRALYHIKDTNGSEFIGLYFYGKK